MSKMKIDPVEYRRGEIIFRGWLADDPARITPRPGVLLVHEAWGLGDYVKQRAERLAEMGYVAFAADMFGEGRQAASTEEGLGWTKALRADVREMRARARLAFDVLAARPEVDSSRIAGIGYCFGGSSVLELARSGAPVRGVVSFHGNLTTTDPARRGIVRAKVLSLSGDDDPFIPLEQVNGFIAEMKSAEVDYQVVLYGGARHSFTNPRCGERGLNGLAYHRLADERSWTAMHAFFAEIFAPAQ
ncbi:MAG TPA: dienelactone hydrolase family protein [Bryobacteraceae bacterium]|jgi:dienelactone hydrolase|nr:dienelactone hydrolase family protein [Bryobacteraceae bacterium]